MLNRPGERRRVEARFVLRVRTVLSNHKNPVIRARCLFTARGRAAVRLHSLVFARLPFGIFREHSQKLGEELFAVFWGYYGRNHKKS